MASSDGELGGESRGPLWGLGAIGRWDGQPISFLPTSLSSYHPISSLP